MTIDTRAEIISQLIDQLINRKWIDNIKMIDESFKSFIKEKC